MKSLVYYRMSSDQQTDSIERQKAEVEPKIAAEGDEVLRVYIDEGKSGSKHQELREEFNRMMEDVRRGTDAKKIWLWNLSRFSRQNPFKAAKFFELLMDRGILIQDCNGRYDLRTQEGRMMVNMLQEFNHKYSTDLADNTTSGRNNLLKRGWWVSGAVPYGYQKQYVGPGGETIIRPRQDKSFNKPRGWHLQLIARPDEAKVVKFIFEEFAKRQDVSFRHIARILNEKAIATPSGKLSGWKKDTVGQILKNKVYAGYSLVGGEHSRYRDDEVFKRIEKNCVRSDKVEALVTERIWNQVADILAKRGANNSKPKPTQAGKLSGVLYCAKCGYALDKASRTDASGNRYTYYCCQSGTNRPGHHDCPQWRVREDDILPFILKELFASTSTAIRELEDSETEKDDKASVDRLQRKLADIEAAKERAYERFLDDPADTGTAKKVWEKKKGEFDRQRDEIEKQLRSLSLVETSKKAIGEGFRQKAMFYLTVFGEDHAFAQAIKAQLGLKNRVEVHIPIAQEDNLRAFLKTLGAKVYLSWQKIGRYHELDAAKITAEFLPNVVAADNATPGLVTKRSA